MSLENYLSREIIGILAGVFSLLAYVPYVFSIIRRKTRPSRSSWWIWSLVGFLAAASYYSAGARSTMWVPVVFFVLPLVVAILSIKFGEGTGLSKIDEICLLGALLSVVVWIILKSASLALFVNIFIDFLGFLPTFHKTYLNPFHENKYSWILFFVGSVLNILAIESFSLVIASYPVYMLVTDIVMLSLLCRGNFLKKNFIYGIRKVL